MKIQLIKAVDILDKNCLQHLMNLGKTYKSSILSGKGCALSVWKALVAWIIMNYHYSYIGYKSLDYNYNHDYLINYNYKHDDCAYH